MAETTAPTRQANFDLAGALHEAEERYVAANGRSAAAFQAAQGSMAGGNTRTVSYFSPFPVMMAKGEGCYLTDLDGHRYTDFVTEQTAGLYGHSNPAIIAAAKRALDGGIVLGAPTPHEGELADLLTRRFPALENVRFTNSGSEANMMALGTARAVTGRDKLMAFEGCYHGSFFTFSGKLTPFNAPFPVVLAPYNDTEKTLALIEANASELAAVMVEPLVGGGGCIPADAEFLKALRTATAKHGILLIFDEVMTSRLGPGGLQKEYGIIPDMMTLGKYVGGGITFGAFGGRADIMARFDPRRPDVFPHNGTYNNNVLTMMAGIAGLKEVFTPEAAIRINAEGDAMRGRLNGVLAKHGVPGEVTGRGSMMAIHFGKGPFRQPADVAKVPADVRALYHFALMEQALYVSRRGMLVLSLPMTQADRDAMVTGFDGFLGAYREVINKVL